MHRGPLADYKFKFVPLGASPSLDPKKVVQWIRTVNTTRMDYVDNIIDRSDAERTVNERHYLMKLEAFGRILLDQCVGISCGMTAGHHGSWCQQKHTPDNQTASDYIARNYQFNVPDLPREEMTFYLQHRRDSENEERIQRAAAATSDTAIQEHIDRIVAKSKDVVSDLVKDVDSLTENEQLELVDSVSLFLTAMANPDIREKMKIMQDKITRDDMEELGQCFANILAKYDGDKSPDSHLSREVAEKPLKDSSDGDWDYPGSSSPIDEPIDAPIIPKKFTPGTVVPFTWKTPCQLKCPQQAFNKASALVGDNKRKLMEELREAHRAYVADKPVPSELARQ